MSTRSFRTSLVALTLLAGIAPSAMARGVFDLPSTIIEAATDGSSQVHGFKAQDFDNFGTGVVTVTSPFAISPEAYSSLEFSDTFARAAAELKAQTFSSWVSMSIRTIAEVGLTGKDTGSADAEARFHIEFAVPAGQQYEWEFSQFTNSASISGRMGLVLSPVGTRGSPPVIYDLNDDNDFDPSNDKGLLDPGVYVLDFSLFSSMDSGFSDSENNLGELNFILNAVPAPSTAMLLGLGGMVALRRRR